MRSKTILIIFWIFFLLIPPPLRADTSQEEEDEEEAPHKPVPVGSYGGIMNPDISVIANIEAFFTDNEDLFNRRKIRIKEAELALQGYLYPGIRGDVIAALEQDYLPDDTVETHVDLEEAYVSFLSLPAGLQVEGGRKFMDFGRLNRMHPHHWPFATTPLVMKNFFGEHNWYDDGVQASILIPNPADVYIKVTGGIWNGARLGHVHGEDAHENGDSEDHEDGEENDGHDHENGEENDPGDDTVLYFPGHVYLGRASVGFMAGDNGDFLFGGSYAGDTENATSLAGADITFTYTFPRSYRRLRWQTEFMRVRDEETGTKPWGAYSFLTYTLNKYWEFGGRFDWTEQLINDQKDVTGGSLFGTYYFTHSMCLRCEYQHLKYSEMGDDNLFYIQFVFGLGPHAHRLQD